jgi:hypothetical protein
LSSLTQERNIHVLQDKDGKISFEEFCRVVASTNIHTKMVVEV